MDYSDVIQGAEERETERERERMRERERERERGRERAEHQSLIKLGTYHACKEGLAN
jgi:hypothetical protein